MADFEKLLRTRVDKDDQGTMRRPSKTSWQEKTKADAEELLKTSDPAKAKKIVERMKKAKQNVEEYEK